MKVGIFCAVFFICVSMMFHTVCVAESVCSERVQKKMAVHASRCGREYSKPVNFFAHLCKNIFELHMNLVNFDLFRIAAITVPPFVTLRMFDEQIHDHFYDARHHKNKHKIDFFNHDVAQNAIAIPIISLASLSILGQSEDIRETSRLFALGMPFVIFTKDVIKKIRFRAAYRPYNQHFEKKRVYGGFPSGHMAEMSFMTVLYSMRHGIKFAIPLTALSLYVGITFVTCNRHYASQIIAGAGFGALYAVAASRVVDMNMEEKRLKKFDVGFDVTCAGEPALSLQYRF